MEKNKIVSIIAGIAIIVGGGSFYGGMKYGQSRNLASNQQNRGNFANLSPEERQARAQQFGAGGQRGTRGTGGGNTGFASGEILSKDDKSVIIKLRDGGSKIIFVSNSTSIAKSVKGSSGDINVGEQITAIGSANTDGSIIAESIQIRPSSI